MANEFKHASAGTELTQAEWEALATHIADGQTTGDMLYFDGTYWKRRPYDTGARVYHDANQTIPDNTLTTLAFNSERWDTDDIHDTVNNNSRLTCKTAGKYLIIGVASFASNSVGRRVLLIRLNGSTTIGVYSMMAITDSGVNTVVIVSIIYLLSVNDYIELRAAQGSGGDLDVLALSYAPDFMMQRIG